MEVMAWPLSSWLVLTRVFQLLAALAAAGMNGFLTTRLYTNSMAVSQAMIALELLVRRPLLSCGCACSPDN